MAEQSPVSSVPSRPAAKPHGDRKDDKAAGVNGRIRRRTRAEVEQRIRDAAQQLFAERGFAATTTKEIARLADSSETLLFRYFGGKSGLFDAVVAAPFNALMRDFVASHSELSDTAHMEIDVQQFTRQVFALLESNRNMFSALLASGEETVSDETALPSGSLEYFFEMAAQQGELSFKTANQTPPMNLDIAVRLAFGMIASAALLKTWLFGERAPPFDEVADVLQLMIERALMPDVKD